MNAQTRSLHKQGLSTNGRDSSIKPFPVFKGTCYQTAWGKNPADKRKSPRGQRSVSKG